MLKACNENDNRQSMEKFVVINGINENMSNVLQLYRI